MSDVCIRFEMEFDNLNGPTFYMWIPDKSPLTVDVGRLHIRLLFPVESAWYGTTPTREEISNLINVQTGYVEAQVQVSNLSDEIISIMKLSLNERTELRRSDALDELDVICAEIHKQLVLTTNRLLLYARSFKGQYWIEELVYDPHNVNTFFSTNKAEISIDGGEYERFIPHATSTINITHPDNDTYITEAEWPNLVEFVRSNRRPPLIGTLLTSSRELWYKGHRRSSLLDAIIALEMALADFSRDFDGQRLPEGLSQRVETVNMPSLISKFGLRGTFGVLLPIIVPEEVLSSQAIKGCKDAIDDRNNIVHNGQRDIDEARLLAHLAHIETFCRYVKSLERQIRD